MKRRIFVSSVVAGLLGLKTSAQTSQQTEFSGVITGRVVNEKVQPVAKAEVCADPATLPWIGELPCGRSDSAGAFTIHVWRPAEYVITAVKEKDGYPRLRRPSSALSSPTSSRATIFEALFGLAISLSSG